MTFREKFDELKAKYGAVDESKLTEPFAIQINMTEDESAGTFYVAFVGGVFSVEPYDYRDHTSMITVPVADLEAVLAKKADPVQLFLSGSLQVEGSVDHALMLVDLMAKEEKKPAKKKAAKPAAKKTVKKAEKTAEKTVEPAVEKPADVADEKPVIKESEKAAAVAEKKAEAPAEKKAPVKKAPAKKTK